MRADQSWTLSLLLLSSLKAGLIQELNPELNQPGGPEADVLPVLMGRTMASRVGSIVTECSRCNWRCRHDARLPKFPWPASEKRSTCVLYHALDSPFCPAGSPVALRRGLRHSTMAAAARGLVGIHQSGGPKARSGGTRGTSLR